VLGGLAGRMASAPCTQGSVCRPSHTHSPRSACSNTPPLSSSHRRRRGSSGPASLGIGASHMTRYRRVGESPYGRRGRGAEGLTANCSDGHYPCDGRRGHSSSRRSRTSPRASRGAGRGEPYEGILSSPSTSPQKERIEGFSEGFWEPSPPWKGENIPPFVIRGIFSARLHPGHLKSLKTLKTEDLERGGRYKCYGIHNKKSAFSRKPFKPPKPFKPFEAFRSLQSSVGAV
jgi:hypothetical protein